MLTIVTPSVELFDERTELFSSSKSYTLQFEHSLLSISKWESDLCIPFLSNKKMTQFQMVHYISCMLVKGDTEGLKNLSNDNYRDIEKYIDRPMTATTIRSTAKGHKNHEIQTAELIYHRMIESGIPFECQKWHLNRLLMLIRVCEEKNSKPKKMSRKETLQRNAELNAQRRAKYGSRG